tara:strand:- start:829 stop:1035 length:207 start_codon:yes stop_codon:yes gene_type:complete
MHNIHYTSTPNDLFIFQTTLVMTLKQEYNIQILSSLHISFEGGSSIGQNRGIKESKQILCLIDNELEK